jgi:serine protease Do
MQPVGSLLKAAALAALAFVALPARADEIDYKKLYAKAGPAVVLIYGEQGEKGSVGTGSIIREDGLVVSNAHVILNHDTGKPFEKLFIFLKPEKITGQNADDLKRGYPAQWISYSADLDLAILRIVNPPANLPVLQLSDDSKVGVGEATAAIGHPEHGAKWSLTTGRIGGEWNDFEGVKGKDVYQMETSVNRGNSGGPLLDGNGFLVGINTSIARRSADGLAITGINFAIKSSVVRRWISERKEPIAAAPEANPPAQATALARNDAPPAAQPQARPQPQAQTEAQPEPQQQMQASEPEAQPAAQPQARAAPPPVAPPTPAQVAKAEPPQVTPEQKVAKATPPRPPAPTTSVPPPPPSAKQITISAALPPPAPEKPRGFTTRERSGRVLSPTDLVKEHANEAFDDLEREAQKHKARK